LIVAAYDRQGAKFGHGFVSGVDNQIDTETGTLKCRAGVIPEADALMLPGRFLNLSLLLEMKHGIIIVPADAIQREPGSTFAWVIRPDGTVTRRAVVVGPVEGKWVGIPSGLSPGETVVCSGFNNLREGQKVRYSLAPEMGPAETGKCSPSSPQPPLRLAWGADRGAGGDQTKAGATHRSTPFWAGRPLWRPCLTHRISVTPHRHG
jgi:multidrug efflux system membrane fusion protein